MDQINYSIIIPHKNIPDLLQRCLNSIPRRKDIQIIIIDDNSDSDKVDFNHFPGKGEPCVEIYFTKEGKGAGYARNVGLRHAKGKWLIFADSDDFFCENVEIAFDKYINSKFDIVYFQIISMYCDTLKLSDRGNFINCMIQRAVKSGNMDLLRYKRLEPWAKFIARRVVIKHNIVFDETIAANDLMFSVLCGYYASRVTVDLTSLYCLTARYGSLAYTINKEVCDAKFEVVMNLNKFLFDIDKKYYRCNIFNYVWPYHYINNTFMIYKCIETFKYGNYPYILVDFVRYIFSCLKNIFCKKSALIKID